MLKIKIQQVIIFIYVDKWFNEIILSKFYKRHINMNISGKLKPFWSEILV